MHFFTWNEMEPVMAMVTMDVFLPIHGGVTTLELLIFNRWGTIII